METLGFIGLGSMGQPMASNLLKAGYGLNVYNRTVQKTGLLAELGAKVMSRPSDVLVPGGIVVTMVSDDAALEEIASDEFMERLGTGGIHLSMSTVAPGTSKKISQIHAKRGSYYVDAPVFGPPPMAAAKKLWICLSGDAKAKRRVLPLLEVLGQAVFDFGDRAGAANLVKVSGNFISFSAAQAMKEVLRAAKGNGIDPNAVVEMFTKTLFPIPIFQYFGKQIALDPETFSLGWIGMKDTTLFKEEAQLVDARTPFADLLLSLLTTEK